MMLFKKCEIKKIANMFTTTSKSQNTYMDMPKTDASRTVKDILGTYDQQKFSWYHVKAIVISGVGFFTDAYDIFIINVVVPMIGFAYFGGTVSAIDQSMMKGAATTGVLIGQVCFGLLGDLFGRKKMYGIELAIMIVATFGASMSSNTASGTGITWMLATWRLILGFGMGGDYPMSAVITSEYANSKTRGAMMAAVFAMQGFGILFGAIISLIVVECYKSAIIADYLVIDQCWRICMAMGIVPAVCALYFRLTLPETPRYTIQVLGDLEKAKRDMVKAGPNEQSGNIYIDHSMNLQKAARMALFRDISKYFRQWPHLKVLIGCAVCWFCLDVAFYGLGLNQNIVLDAIGFLPPKSNSTVLTGQFVYDNVFDIITGNIIINLLGTVPGYWITVLFVEKLGRFKIQIGGFAMLTVIFVTLAAAFYQIKNYSVPLFVFIYSMGQLFFNFGPNATTFIIPGEVFPTRFRSTGHGISAACGKAGAMLASLSIPTINQNHGIVTVLAMCSGFMFAGTLFTLLVPETKGKTLEDISGGEDYARLIRNSVSSCNSDSANTESGTNTASIETISKY